MPFAFDKGHGIVAFVFKTTALSWLAVSVLLLPVAITVVFLNKGTESPALDSGLAPLVIAPLLENIIFIGVVEFMITFDVRVGRIVMTVALLSALVHGITEDWRALAGFVMFATMSYSYLLWRECGFLKRYAITVAQHALFNLPSTLVLLMAGV